MKFDWILLDMDGVIADLGRGLCRLFNVERLPDVYKLEETLGISTAEMWQRVETQGAEFWAQLDPFSWTTELFAMLGQHGPVVVCSSPTLDPNCAKGKVQWLQQQFGRGFRDFVITPRKELYARPGVLLIDDYDINVEHFRERGGEACIFPQGYNQGRDHAADPLAYIRERLNVPI